MATNFGGLFVFVASYTLISEGYLKKSFSLELNSSIKAELEKIKENHSISESELPNIIPRFSSKLLHERVSKSENVKMVVVKNMIYFRENYESIREKIADNNLNLDILIPDPNDKALMEVITRRYDEYSEDQLAVSIFHYFRTWLKNKVYDKVPNNAKANIQIYLTQQHPPYSAYLFDNDELWYIPYHSRPGRHSIPIFVFKNLNNSPKIYKDIIELFRMARKIDLSNDMELMLNDRKEYFVEPINSPDPKSRAGD